MVYTFLRVIVDFTMITAITYPSALKYWLYEDFPFSFGNKQRNNPSAEGSTSVKYLRAAEYAELPIPVHVLFSGASTRIHNKNLHCHVLSAKLPAESFVDLGNSVRIISPELCFLLAAKTLSFSQLVLLGCDLCAIYARDESGQYGQRSREPVTSVSKIKAYLQKVKNVDGIYKARQAANYILDRSNSPMESILAVLMNLPISRGGYRLLTPKLNYDVGLNEEGEKVLKRSSCCCDFVWPEKELIAEYDSNSTHLEINQHYTDKRRMNALTLSGKKVISITREHFSSFSRLEELFRLIRKALNMRAEKKEFEKYRNLRIQVVRELLRFRYNYCWEER